MKTLVFSVFDSKAAVFSPPFYSQNQGMALRSFKDMVNDPQTIVFRNPEDFSLIQIGEFDDSVGVLTPQPHSNVATAAAFKTPEDPVTTKDRTELMSVVNDLKMHISNLFLSRREENLPQSERKGWSLFK